MDYTGRAESLIISIKQSFFNYFVLFCEAIEMENMQSLFYSLRFNFLYADVYTFTRMWVYPTTVLPYGLLRYIFSGEADFWLDGRLIHVRPNQVVYLPEGATLDCKALTDDFKFMSIRFVTTVRLQSSDFLSDYFHVESLADDDARQVRGYFEAIYQAATTHSRGRMFRIRGNLELIIAWLAEQGEASQAPAVLETQPYSIERTRRRAQSAAIRDPRIQAVEDYLADHPKDKLDLKLLCEIAQVSEPSLRRLFKLQTGKSPGHYLRELHMLTAARELLVSEKRISDIAYDLGYDDPNYFSRVFKSIIGLSPQDYRKVSRE